MEKKTLEYVALYMIFYIGNKKNQMENGSILKYTNKKNNEIGLIEKFLNNPIRNEVIQSKKRHYFYWKTNKKMLNGLTRTIKKKFFPNFSYDKMTKRKVCSSKKTGIRVHSELYHHYHCSFVEFKDDCRCECVSNSNKFHRYTKQAIEMFKKMEIEINDSEVIIFSRELKIATKIDMIGTRWKGTDKEKMVVISIKTGSHNKYRKPDKMIGPLNFVDSIPSNHAQLQSMVEHMILEKEYNVKVTEYYILYLTNGDTIVEYLSGWCLDTKNRQNVYDFLK